MWSTLLDLLVPRRCAVCARFSTLASPDLCATCAATWEATEVEPTSDGTPRFTVALHEGAARDAVIALKFRGEQWRGRPLGRMLASASRGVLPAYDVVVPVPLGRRRLRKRGYNQAAEVAFGFASATGDRVDVRSVRRFRETTPQSTLSAEERRAIRGAFAASVRPGTRVLLVDDVSTTGETLAACTLAVEACGAWVAAGLSVTYAPRPEHAADG